MNSLINLEKGDTIIIDSYIDPVIILTYISPQTFLPDLALPVCEMGMASAFLYRINSTR